MQKKKIKKTRKRYLKKREKAKARQYTGEKLVEDVTTIMMAQNYGIPLR